MKPATGHFPYARSAGFSCAAACNVRPASSLAFVRHSFDLPIPSTVLQQHAAVAALAVQRVATACFTRAIVNAVDGGSVETHSAGDEEDEGVRHGVIEDVIDCKLDGGMLFEDATRTFSGAAGDAYHLLDFRR